MDFSITAGTREPSLVRVLRDARGPINLTGATVTFTMTRVGGGTSKVAAAACTVVSATSGTVRYDWAAADTNAPGDYYGRFKITWPSANTQEVPDDAPLLIRVRET
jgi:hypothetical protein